MTMLQINDHEPTRKPDDVHVGDDGADLAVFLIAARYGLKPHVARAVCELAHIGAGEDRAPTSGGRAK